MAWTILVCVAVFCVLLSVIYGIQFDIKAEEMEIYKKNKENVLLGVSDIEENNGLCWNISHQLSATHQVYNEEILSIQEEQERIADLNEPYDDDFFIGYDSTKWLLNVLVSFLTSVFIWQPASIYLLTWIKIWAFHHGLIMEASIYNMWMFCCCCCLKSKKKKFGHTKAMLELAAGPSVSDGNNDINYVREDSMSEVSISGSSGFAVVANDDRALDVIGFLCNDDLFVELPDDFESSYTSTTR
eukprot:UN00426